MSKKTRLLLLDDEPIKRVVMEDQLREEGFIVDVYDNPLAADDALIKNTYDVIITDIRMPGMDGITFLKKIKNKNPNQAVIVMTAFGTVETAIEAMKLGAFDYLQKPFSTEELILKLDRLMNYRDIVEENQTLRKQLGQDRTETKLIGKSAAMRDVLSKIHTLATVDSNVLIHGVSGTGKECVARLIHESSVRSNGPFIAVSCASLPSELIEAELFGYEEGAFTGASRQRTGRFELADGGTIFLDDIDDIPLSLQVKLLRVIQERQLERIGSEVTLNVNFRLVTASKKNLSSLVEDGQFREDLYFRLNIIPLYLPPLRERKTDIPLLCEYFMGRFAIRLNHPEVRIDEEVIEKLTNYSWPGNVRELENIIERMLVLSRDGHITIDQLPKEFFEPDTSTVTINTDYIDQIDLPKTVDGLENRLVKWALAKAEGNLAKAASLLNIPRSSLQYKVSKLDAPV
ncbi:MAG: sigma-54-dependent Fis family transcriptional regulator [Planctomycetes bacterium]|nr:sigma-54-dependent Fis family transcriptional regulator [Planctomycetota bacterium]